MIYLKCGMICGNKNMNITKINYNYTNNNNDISFKAKLSENEIMFGLERIMNSGSKIVEKNMDYFVDMKRGNNIDPIRKQNIQEWLTDKLSRATSFDQKREERLAREEIAYRERQENNNKILRGIKRLISTMQSSRNEKSSTNPVIQRFNADCEEANFFTRFKDLFSSYLELIQKPVEKKEEKPLELSDIFEQIAKENFGLNLNAKVEVEATISSSTNKATTIHPQTSAKITESLNPSNDLLTQFEELEQRRMKSKPRTQMTPEEIEEDCKWYREVYYPLLEKIKQQNISTIPKKSFSDNPLEQVQEKHDYIQYVLSRMRDNEASYYDGMVAFEKYGINGPAFETGEFSTLSFIRGDFPNTPTERCVNKLMDLYEKFAKGVYLDDEGLLAGIGDDISYMGVIAEKGAITSIPQLKRALEKGKKFIWSNDGIDKLHKTLTYGEDAPFKNNQEVEDIIQQFYQTAFNNRTPFKDNFDIQAYERVWGIKR